jgi:type 1 glutamine amidotransferase
MSRLLLFTALLAGASTVLAEKAINPWLTLDGGDGPGKGKHIVLVSGDEEYRSEESLTQLARILAKHHGFKCTVLYAIDKKDGTINPNQNDNIPGLEALASADLMVIFTRFRNLPDEQMKHIDDYVATGKPIVGLRTATHAFSNPKSPAYARYHWQSKEWPGGFGKQILGETWVAHHGAHGKEGTRGILVKEQANHPILRGIKDGDIFGTTDVYTVNLPLPGDSRPLVLGEVTETLLPDSKPVEGKKNSPMMPVAWTKTYTSEKDKSKTGRVFTTTMGASQDIVAEGTRRMLVNACYWALGMEKQIPARSDVDIVGEFKPSPFRTNGFVRGVKPSDLAK